MWKYLDRFNGNILYSYAYNEGFKSIYSNDEKSVESIKEENNKRIFYLIHFVYRYVLGCKSYEETIPYQTQEILKKYNLEKFFFNPNKSDSTRNKGIPVELTIGNELIGFIRFTYNSKTFHKRDIEVVLKILYYRYNLPEQIDCYIKTTEAMTKGRKIGLKQAKIVQENLNKFIEDMAKRKAE